MSHRGLVVAALGTTQTLAWASSYYLPAILADGDNFGTWHAARFQTVQQPGFAD